MLGSALVCSEVLGLSCDWIEPVRSLEEREAAIIVGCAVQETIIDDGGFQYGSLVILRFI